MAGDDTYKAALMEDAAARTAATAPDATIKVKGAMQFRYSADLTNLDEDYQGGFSLPLVRLGFNGTLGLPGSELPKLNYDIVARFNEEDNSAYLETAAGNFLISESTKFTFGQFVLPFMYERMVDDLDQLTMDRSFLSDEFGQGYSQGIMLTHNVGDLRLYGAFSDGFDSTGTAESDYALTGRADYLLSGRRLDSFTNASADEWLIGGAVHYQGAGELATLTAFTIDSFYRADKLSLYAAGVLTDVSDESLYGVNLQAGYLVTDSVEPFARYEISWDADEDTASLINGGVNYYFAGPRNKITADVVYALDDVSVYAKDDIAARLQIQLAF